jgi:hypothetical protein
MEQREEFSFLSSVRDDPTRRRGAVLAIIISPALPIIAIVLTNAQIAFQIAPPLRKQGPLPFRWRCCLLNAEAEGGGAGSGEDGRERGMIKRDGEAEITRGKVSSHCRSRALRGNAVIARPSSIVFLPSSSSSSSSSPLRAPHSSGERGGGGGGGGREIFQFCTREKVVAGAARLRPLFT